jgi:hypothetical protein
VVGLFFWQSELDAETSDAVGIASLNNPASTELWSD